MPEQFHAKVNAKFQQLQTLELTKLMSLYKLSIKKEEYQLIGSENIDADELGIDNYDIWHGGNAKEFKEAALEERLERALSIQLNRFAHQLLCLPNEEFNRLMAEAKNKPPLLMMAYPRFLGQGIVPFKLPINNLLLKKIINMRKAMLQNHIVIQTPGEIAAQSRPRKLHYLPALGAVLAITSFVLCAYGLDHGFANISWVAGFGAFVFLIGSIASHLIIENRLKALHQDLLIKLCDDIIKLEKIIKHEPRPNVEATPNVTIQAAAPEVKIRLEPSRNLVGLGLSQNLIRQNLIQFAQPSSPSFYREDIEIKEDSMVGIADNDLSEMTAENEANLEEFRIMSPRSPY